MTLGDHLEELRGCLIYCLILLVASTILAACFFTHIVNFLTQPIHWAFEQAGVEPQLVSGLLNTFISIVKAVFIAGLVVASPLIAKQGWKFIRPGLKDIEAKALKPLLFFGAFFFIGGAVFAYYLVAPLGMSWLLNLNQEIDVTSLIPINESIDMVVSMMLLFGLTFETPLIIMGLLKADIIALKTLKSARRYVILAAFILGAFFTPPDILTQLILGSTLICLYELGMILGTLTIKKK